jgi:hypothetical protein
MRKTITRSAASVLAFIALGLAGCGGGGGGGAPATPPPPPQATSAEGFWTGTASSGFSILGAVLENGDYWVMYHANGLLYGVVQGNGTSNSGSFTSTNGLDLYLAGGATPVVVSGSYRERTSLQGTVTYPSDGGAVTFTAAYDASYEVPATASAISGVWHGALLSGETYTINVASNGSFTGAGSSGCTFSGTAVPRPSGKAVYNVSVSFNGGVCLLGTQTITGIAVIGGSGASAVMYAAALNANRSQGLVLISRR